jgi:hypothetical protein
LSEHLGMRVNASQLRPGRTSEPERSSAAEDMDALASLDGLTGALATAPSTRRRIGMCRLRLGRISPLPFLTG